MRQEIFVVYQLPRVLSGEDRAIVGLFSNMKSAYECKKAGTKAGITRWVEDYCVDDAYMPEQDHYLVDYDEDHP